MIKAKEEIWFCSMEPDHFFLSISKYFLIYGFPSRSSIFFVSKKSQKFMTIKGRERKEKTFILKILWIFQFRTFNFLFSKTNTWLIFSSRFWNKRDQFTELNVVKFDPLWPKTFLKLAFTDWKDLVFLFFPCSNF